MTHKKLVTFALLAFAGAGLAATAYRAAGDRRAPATAPIAQPQSAQPAAPGAPTDVPSKAGYAASKEAPAVKAKARILAYYFHGSARCQTCRKLEAYAREAIESGFAPELKSGRITWQVVNVEEPENRHFIQDFQLTNKSVVLTMVRGGAVKDWKNLSMIWELVGDKDRFLQYIQGEVRASLAKS